MKWPVTGLCSHTVAAPPPHGTSTTALCPGRSGESPLRPAHSSGSGPLETLERSSTRGRVGPAVAVSSSPAGSSCHDWLLGPLCCWPVADVAPLPQKSTTTLMLRAQADRLPHGDVRRPATGHGARAGSTGSRAKTNIHTAPTTAGPPRTGAVLIVPSQAVEMWTLPTSSRPPSSQPGPGAGGGSQPRPAGGSGRAPGTAPAHPVRQWGSRRLTSRLTAHCSLPTVWEYCLLPHWPAAGRRAEARASSAAAATGLAILHACSWLWQGRGQASRVSSG
jgi:hypothetical protein